MTTALKNVISSIPTMEEAEFNELAQAVFLRLNVGMQPLTREQWTNKLDRSLAQARKGERTEAATLTSRIRAI